MKSRNTLPFFKGEIIDRVTVVDMSMQGMAIVKPKGYVVFVAGLLIGEEATIRITDVQKNYAKGESVIVIKKAAERVDEVCPYQNQCGGCQYLAIDYAEQIRIKEQQLSRMFERDVEVIRNSNQYHYRNKITLAVKNKGEIELGYYSDKNKFVAIESCLIAHKELSDLIPIIKESLNHNTKAAISQVVLRISEFNGDIMIGLVSNISNRFQNKIAMELVGYNNKIKSVFLSLGTSINYLFNDNFELLYGVEAIMDVMNHKKFIVSPKSFYQVNNQQTEQLYNKVIEMGDYSDADNVLDLYCGVGTIGILAADYANYVLGIEKESSAVSNARLNVDLNEVRNIDFTCQDLNEGLITDKKINKAIVDPPRNGLSEKVVEFLLQQELDSVVYISCNPITLKRDLAKLTGEHYKIDKMVSFDMFSNTYHVESVVSLSKQ